MQEIWKDVKGYEGLYQISNFGNVMSLNYRNTSNPQKLTPKKNKDGYLWVELRKNAMPKPFLIHRLVAMAFIPNPNNYPVINHKDENKSNNNFFNLEWCTHSYNVLYSLKKHSRNGCGIKRVKKSGEPYKYKGMIIQKTLDGEILQNYSSSLEAARANGYSQWSISECCRGNRKTAYGYKWEFAT